MIGAIAVGFAAGPSRACSASAAGSCSCPRWSCSSGLTHLEAEATSLLAIVPVALVGAWSQRRYGNLRVRDGIVIGALAVPGALGGVALANVVPERALELGFAGLLVVAAVQLVRKPATR